jgi:N-acyl-D-aspartate/D-glutamate deacylase
VFEEFATTRPLLECPLEDREGRRAILANPDYIAKFERDWSDTNIISTFQRNLGIMFVDSSPVPEWAGEQMAEIFARVKRYNAGDASAARSDAEATACKLAADSLRSDPVFFLHLLREYDRDIRFHFTVGNDRPEILEQLLFDENTLPGFNDSGAHLINMAFFDGNLMTLKIAQKRDLERVALAVKRLTRDPAAFFGLDAGSIEIGKAADITLVDPVALEAYNSDANRQLLYREVLRESQIVNRSDGVVDGVYIAGTRVWNRDHFLPALGQQKLGRALRYAGRAG